MTPLPPACVAAVHDTVGRMGAIGKRPKFSETCEDVARAVLDAFVAGEGTGPWKVAREFDSEADERNFEWWVVCSPHEFTDDIHFESKSQADGCAAVLNYLEAKGE